MTPLPQPAQPDYSGLPVKETAQAAEKLPGVTDSSKISKTGWFNAFWDKIKSGIQPARLLAMTPIFKLNFKKPNEQPENPGLFMKPIEGLKQAKNSILWVVLVLIVAGIAAALGYLYFNEVSLNQRISSRLRATEQTRETLAQTVEQLKNDLVKQTEEAGRLSTELQVSSTKAGMIEVLQRTHQEEIDRLTKLYEDQLQSLRRILETRDSVIQTLESNLKVIRRILESGASQGAVGLSISNPEEGIPGANSFEAAIASTDFSSKSGSVLLVDRQQRYIIVNIGPAEGAKVGRTVHVYQNGRFLGEGKIERVYKTLSAVNIISDDLLEKVNTGDSVFFTL